MPKLVLPATLAIAVLVTTASLLGLAEPWVYEEETRNWALQAKGQDIGNLLAVPALLLGGYGYMRGSHRAALVWLGTLLYFVYAYVVYALAVHFNELFLVYLVVLGLSVYAVLLSVPALLAVHRTLPEPRSRWLAGSTSLAVGVVFALLWLSELVPATLSGDAPPSVRDAGLWVNPIHVIDLAVLLPAFVVAGVQALQRRPGGLFFVGPLLWFSVLMGTSIVASLVLMTAHGFDDTLPPLVLVSVVVLACLVAAVRDLAPTSNEPGAGTTPDSRVGNPDSRVGNPKSRVGNPKSRVGNPKSRTGDGGHRPGG